LNHNGTNVEARLWTAADELRANSKLKSSEYSVPVLGLVFLRYADHKFQAAAKALEGAAVAVGASARRTTRRRASCTCPKGRASRP
jgi:hypothetical protein